MCVAVVVVAASDADVAVAAVVGGLLTGVIEGLNCLRLKKAEKTAV